MKYHTYPMGLYTPKPKTHWFLVLMGLEIIATMIVMIRERLPIAYAMESEPEIRLEYPSEQVIWIDSLPIEMLPDGKGPTNPVITARITKYSRKDSCHNPRGNECLTAIGRDTKEGTTVACPHDIKLGTKIEIGGHVYTCEDRTARWVQKERGTTFDIFTEDYDSAVEWGVKKMDVQILK